MAEDIICDYSDATQSSSSATTQYESGEEEVAASSELDTMEVSECESWATDTVCDSADGAASSASPFGETLLVPAEVAANTSTSTSTPTTSTMQQDADDAAAANNVAAMNQVTLTKMRLAMAVVTRLVLPAMLSVYYALIRNHKTVFENMRRHLVPAVLAFLANSISRSLSSVQDVVLRPNKKESPDAMLESPGTPVSSCPQQEVPEKSVSCSVLFEPPPGEPVRADVIFIHGLHGSLVKTWRQGVWDPNRKHVDRVEVVRGGGTSSYNICPKRSSPRPLKRSVSLPANCGACCPSKKPSMATASSDDEEENNALLRRLKVEHVCMNGVLSSGVESAPAGACASECGTQPDNGAKPPPPLYSRCWPQDWLPKDCPGVRVLALNYTTDPYLWRPVWIRKRIRTTMQERSREMMDHLLELGVGKRPIVWVGHSKGGLFVKQMIVDAWESQQPKGELGDDEENRPLDDIGFDPRVAAIYTQTRGIMFYSVPHRGSALADMNLPLLRQSIELTEIQKDCPGVLDLHRRFMRVCDSGQFDPEIFSFIETSLTFMSILYLRIVAMESADPGVGETCGVPLDHRDICKPTGRDCFLYQELAELINRVV